MKNRNLKFSCVVDTTYTLSLYLLYQSEETIQETAFFVGRAIPESVSAFLPYVIRINNSREDYYGSSLKMIKHHLISLFRWRFRHKTNIFAQDHLVYSAHIIGSNNYILLEDAPNIYTNYKTIKFMKPILPSSNWQSLKEFLIRGSIGRRRLGTNSQCIGRLVSSKKDLKSELLVGKKYILVNLSSLWEDSSSSKQELIKRMFDISDPIISLPQKCSTIIFSQPLMEDCHLSEQEIVDIYSPYIEKFAAYGIAIKPHPRDKFEYRKYFPNTEMLECKAPMQLLSAMGVVFKTAITVCSSAVSSMPEETEIIWIGSRINEKVFAVYGDLKCPK